MTYRYYLQDMAYAVAIEAPLNEAEAIAYHALGVAGLVMSTLYRHTLLPLISKISGELHTRRLERTLKSHPESLICRNCNHVIRRK